jgi:hypothetical protein
MGECVEELLFNFSSLFKVPLGKGDLGGSSL